MQKPKKVNIFCKTQEATRVSWFKIKKFELAILFSFINSSQNDSTQSNRKLKWNPSVVWPTLSLFIVFFFLSGMFEPYDARKVL